MDTRQIAQQMIAFNKTAFENNYNSLKALQEQSERLIDKFYEKSPIFTEEGKKSISEWREAYKKSCDDFKNIMDNNIRKVEDFLTNQSSSFNSFYWPRKNSQ
ncbi:MAG: hypothetical protein CVU74_00410 [Deltaproteobacteria bacterium HGW-Deltaproteobacteria-9]|nr:MAG: hypothetical protein CVU74_00410 [Deltaproteobacteria bacterium HGW-Deltaproteobacteria-9]